MLDSDLIGSHRSLLLAAATLVLVPSVSGADVDPIELLRAASAAADEADSVETKLVAETTLVRDDKTDVLADAFAFRTAPEGRFEFVALGNDGRPSGSGFRVAGNGEVTLTHLVAARRHMLSADDGGLAFLVRSPLSARIGNGLGGLAIALLNPAATNDLIESISASEYVGEEVVDGKQAHRARYSVADDVEFEAWFDADTGLIRRVRPDVLQTEGVRQMAARYENFDYQLEFRFEDWNASAGLTGTDIRVIEPKSSLLVASLFGRPPAQLYALLGEPAPSFVLATPHGQRFDLAESIGKEVVMLEFWQTTCHFCVQAMPALEELHEKFRERGFAYFAVNVEEPAGDVAAFLSDRGLEPTALLDDSAEVADAYDVSGFPLIVLIGLDGKVQVAHEGFPPGVAETLANQVEALLAGEDLAATAVADQQAAQAERTNERKRLRSRLDG